MVIAPQFRPLETNQPLRSAVVRQIQDEIMQGNLCSGDQLPTESELCEQFNVSRTVIREALLVLRQRGLLESRRGTGTFVTECPLETVSEAVVRLLQIQRLSIWDVHELREILEPNVASLAAERAEEADIQCMVEALERMEEDFADEDLRIEADLDFHLAIANATGNPAFRVILVPVMDVLLESRRLGVRISGELTKAISHHQAILDYIRDRDPAGARNAMLEHLDLVSSAMRKALQIEAGRECLG